MATAIYPPRSGFSVRCRVLNRDLLTGSILNDTPLCSAVPDHDPASDGAIFGLPVIPGSDPPPGSPAHTSDFLQDLVLESTDVDHFLHTFAGLAADYLARLDHEVHCGVTLLRPRLAETLASSSPTALKLDRLQYSFGDGPCLTAVRTLAPVYVRDTRTDDRWPAYTAAVSRHGMLSILGVPIPLEGEADCGLNLYSSAADGFSPEAMAAAGAFALEASRSLRLAVRMAQLSDKADNLSAALESRTVIDLAVGMVMGQNRCSQAEAATILKAASSRRQIKLRILAAELVRTVNDEAPITHFE